MRCISVIGAMFKHLFGFCFFFVLGLVVGYLPLGLLVSFVTGDGGKDAPLCGSMMGAVGLSFAYVTICLHGRFCRQDGPDWTERQIKHLLGWSFFTFLGIVLAVILEFFVVPSQGYCLLGGFFFPIGYAAYWHSVENRAVADSTNGELQQSDSITLESDASEKIRSKALSRSSNSTPFLQDNPTKCISVIGALFKHSVALCLLFVLGFVVGVLPLGILISYLTDVWVKDARLYGGMIGAVGLSIAYVAICLRGRFDRQQGPERTERLIKHLFGWSFFSFNAVVLGVVLVFCEFVSSRDYCLMGVFCVSIGYVAYRYYGIPLRTAGTTQNDSTRFQRQ